jgi:hypothetical protein
MRDARASGLFGPALPAGYEAQQAWGFHDPSGRFCYKFNRVYGPPIHLDEREPMSHLDEGMSYWVVLWAAFSDIGDERPTGRWLTYAQARELRGAQLTFARFSSPSGMRNDLVELLRVDDIGPPKPRSDAHAAVDRGRQEARAAAAWTVGGWHFHRGT